MSIRDHKELEEQSFPSDSVQILDWIFSGKNDEKRVAVALRTKPGSAARGEMNWRRERDRERVRQERTSWSGHTGRVSLDDD